MLTPQQLQIIHQAIPLPDVATLTCKRLGQLLDSLRDASPADPIDEGEVLVAVLGPRGCGPVPPDVLQPALDEICGMQPAQADQFELCLDRLTVFGLVNRELENANSAEWNSQWPGARERLEALVGRLIEGPVRKICWRFSRVIIADEGADWDAASPPASPDTRIRRIIQHRVERELWYCELVLTDRLIKGTCTCLDKAAYFDNRSKNTRRRCQEQHRLPGWDRNTRLELFLQTATIAHGFRYGRSFGKTMLAAVVMDGRLVSGDVLLCEGCKRWKEQCRCEIPKLIKKRAYSISGQRVYGQCCKCDRCGYYYYDQDTHECPGGGATELLPGGTASSPVAHVPHAIDPSQSPSVTRPERDEAAEWLNKLRTHASNWDPSPEKDAITAMLWPALHEGATLERRTRNRALARLWREDQGIHREPTPKELDLFCHDLIWTLRITGEASPGINDTTPLEESDSED